MQANQANEEQKLDPAWIDPENRYQTKKVEIVCHRGANQYAPENTYASAQLCIDWKADYLEIDINQTVDGQMYVFHGPKLEGIGGQGIFSEQLSSYIETLDAGSWFDAKFKNEKIPKLEEFFQYVQGKIKLFLDIKKANVPVLLALIKKYSIDCFI